MTGDGSGAAYTRFAEEMDIDTLDLKVRNNYDNYGRWPAIRRWCSHHRKTIGLLAFALCLFFVGIVIGHFLHYVVVEHCETETHNETHTTPMPPPTTEPAPHSNYSDILHTLIKNDTLDSYLKQYTQRPHYAASPDSEQIIAGIKNAWASAGGFKVYTKKYQVQLSRPNRTHPTRFDTYGNPPVCCNTTYYPNDDPENNLLPGFNPYGANIDIEADLVYINYGTWRDFITLKEIANIPIEGKICLVRQGKLNIRSIARACRYHGGIALVVFPDTLHYTPNITKDADPNTWWLPVNATIRDPVRMAFGDPLTPFLPSLEYGSVNDSAQASKLQETISEDVNDPMDFPIQTIGYEQARQYLTNMSYPAAPADWQGIKLRNHTFKVGPGFNSHAEKFKMKVNNVLTTETITNIFGMIKGDVEPDRYVIIGNHRDSLTYGGVEPGTGTAILMELARVLGGLYKNDGWRPRRTIILASWDAGDDGNIGSAEWVEENVEVLRERTVAYINLDGAVEGNYTFSATGSPLLTDIIYYATKRVKCPHAAHSNNMRVYENWVKKKPSQTGAEIEALGLGNDAAPFLHVAGVPVLDLKYTYDKEYYGGIPTYPVKHTAYDTYDYVKRFIDPDMSIHVAVTEVVAEALLSLADDPLLKINVVNYADKLVEYLRELNMKNFTVPLDEGLGHLNQAIQKFTAAAQEFHNQYYIPPDLVDETHLRELNDRVMLVERAFSGDPGNYYLPQLRHVVYGPSMNGYDGQGFGPLTRALYMAKWLKNWELVQPALSGTIARIDSAVHLLTGTPLSAAVPLT
nr:N-acetylated-alpha-linked acidic dipeptidase 2-like isoform X1 [Lytechinus pictus]XP_054768946.1 N-acetylated-alpha-linked acidic dipeptidase 2-like isoform X1 [Lytechinus pictus]XP_054768947.1 N-acetylated-alpha-linked acidic dipeptidase 2-like isoform X1 [Lytechinus pictus]